MANKSKEFMYQWPKISASLLTWNPYIGEARSSEYLFARGIRTIKQLGLLREC